jgi:LSD1 subclass zinc finger protein
MSVSSSSYSGLQVDDQPSIVAENLTRRAEASGTTECKGCRVLLLFPKGANCIQCGNCKCYLNVDARNTSAARNVEYILCEYCTTVLSFPSEAQEIQCPECNNVHIIEETPTAQVAPKTPAQQHMDVARAKRQEAAEKGMVRDPSMPTRPRNAFVVYTDAKMADVEAEFEADCLDGDEPVRFAELAGAVAEYWRALTSEEKQPYQETATREKGEYEAALAVYMKKGGTGFVMPKEDQASRKRKQPEEPSRA